MSHYNSTTYDSRIENYDGFTNPSDRVEDFSVARENDSENDRYQRDNDETDYNRDQKRYENGDSPREYTRYVDNGREYSSRSRSRRRDDDYDYDRYDDGERWSSRRRSRSRSRDRERRRDRYRNSSRERRYEDERADQYLSSRQDRRSRSRERESRRDYGRSDSSAPPSTTVIVQGLSTSATEDMIKDVLKLDGVQEKSVCIVRDRNGDSRGFAFVEFDDVVTAELWLKITKRQVVINDRRSYLNFSHSKKPTNMETVTRPPIARNDWDCATCGAVNFGSKRKTNCYQCGAVKKELGPGESIKGSDVVKLEPCNVLMIRGMDFSTTEDMIRLEISKLTSHPIYDVRLIKDKVTDMSRGFAFVELGTTEHAKDLLEAIESIDPPFEIEGRRITIGYARHGYNAPISNKKATSKRQGTSVSKQTLVNNAVAQGSAANAPLPQYSQSTADNSHLVTQDSNLSQLAPGSVVTTQGMMPSQYSYDATTGFYYDASSGLYYDPNSGYYYNGTTGQYLFWNGSRYQPVPQDGSVTTQNTSTLNIANTEQDQKPATKEIDGKVTLHGQKPKDARKIAKDMERWAKKMNSANEARKSAVKQAQDELRMLEQKEEELRKKIVQEKQIVSTLDTVVKMKDGVRSMFVPDNEDEGSVLKLGAALKSTVPPKPTNQIVSDVIDEDDDIIDESRFVDTIKLMCLLCKRQFPSIDVLTKHLQMSQLHKQNVDNYRKNKKK